MAANFWGFGSVPIDYSPNFLGAVTWEPNGPGSSQVTMINLDDAALDVWTGTVGGTVTSIAFTDPSGVAQSFSISSSTTAAAVVAGIEASSTETLTAWANLAVTGASTFTVTSKQPGMNLTLTATTGVTYSHTTTGSLGSDLKQGRAVMLGTIGTQPGAISIQSVKTVDNLSDQVVTLSPVYGASSSYDITVRLYNYKNGVTQDIACGVVVANTNTATDCTAIAAAINAAMPSNTVIADGTSGTTVVCTAEVSGLAFDINVNISGGTATCAKAYTTGAPGNRLTDLAAAIAGIVPHSTNIVQDASGNPVWQAGRPGLVCVGPADITVEDLNSDNPSTGAAVWVNTGVTNPGAFGYAAGADMCPLPRSMAQVVAEDTGGNVKIMFNALMNA